MNYHFRHKSNWGGEGGGGEGTGEEDSRSMEAEGSPCEDLQGSLRIFYQLKVLNQDPGQTSFLNIF